MDWLQATDIALFRFLNDTLSNPVLDVVMPFLSGNSFFIPLVILLALGLLWKGGARGFLFVFVLLFIFILGDVLVISTLKHAVGRARPYVDLAGVRMLAGLGNSGSMPSSHTSTWFAATLIAYVYYRRSLWFMLPLAILVGLSRIYVGVHYPSDVLAGAVLGAGYAAAGLWSLNALWQRIGREWFPEWWRRMPSLLNPVLQPKPPSQADAASKVNDQLFLRLGYLAIAVIFLARLAYIASGVIQLSEDEAYQWLWSKHLALSYYSKPPLIAYTQFLGTSLWGDNAFGVRFFSPVMAALVSFLLLRFLAREVNARVGLCLILIINCTPLIAVGATLLTIDPLLVLFWTAAMIAGWRAVQPNSTTRPWLWVGLWMGLGFLSKYNAAFQILCWGLFFALWPPARAQLKRPGPYLALLITLLCTAPVLIWNAQHDWITVEHVSSHAHLGEPWKPTLRFFWDFLFSESMLLNPVFFVAAIWATFAFWKRDRKNPLFLFFFCMGSPIFLGHWLYSLHSRILPNWIAPAILPMLGLMVVYWHRRWQEGARVVRIGLKTGVALGLIVVALLHDTNLIGKIIGHPLPADKDPLHRVRTWSEIARVAGEARTKLLAEGKPVFIIAAHYGLVGQISFYLPEAKASVKQTPMVYYQTTTRPQNQFYFWPGYRETRHGDNAIYVQEIDASPLPGDWFKNWITGRNDLLVQTVPPSPPPSEELLKEFDSISDLGVFEIKYRGRTFRYLHILACRNLH